jgi:hypothetical protein
MAEILSLSLRNISPIDRFGNLSQQYERSNYERESDQEMKNEGALVPW